MSQLNTIRAESDSKNLLVTESTPIVFNEGEVQAESGTVKIPTFEMRAYNGGLLSLPNHPYPVIADLQGMRIEHQIPILRQHDPNKVIGHADVSIDVENSVVTASGVVSGAGADALEVKASSTQGFPWQASIGASIHKAETVAKGKTVYVNGQAFHGPVIVARATTLNEISFVALGADRQTSAKVAASRSDEPSYIKGNDMKFDKWLEAKGIDADGLNEATLGVIRAQFEAEYPQAPEAPKAKTSGLLAEIEIKAAEQRRIDDIDAVGRELLAQFPNSVQDIEKSVRAAHEDKSCNADGFRGRTLQTIMSGPAFNPNSGKETSPKVFEAGLALTMGWDVDKMYDERTLEAASAAFGSGLGLKQLLFRAAKSNGAHYDGTGDMRGLLQAAFGVNRGIQAQGFSTFSLPGILSSVMGKALVNYFENGVADGMPDGQVWDKISAIGSVSDFRQITSYSLTSNLEYLKLGPQGEIKHGVLDEKSYTNKADTYARMLAISREDIINDDLGALARIPNQLAAAALRTIHSAFWSEYLNNATFFVAGNNNVSSGAGLDAASLAAAEAVFYAQTDPQGNPLGILPRILLVPPSLYNDALTLMNSANTTGGTANVGDANVFRGRYQVLSSPYLSNTNFTGNSTKAWYLLADPRQMPTVQVVFLNGRRVPVIETADVDFNTLGIQFRGYHDFGVALQEPKGGVRATGEA